MDISTYYLIKYGMPIRYVKILSLMDISIRDILANNVDTNQFTTTELKAYKFSKKLLSNQEILNDKNRFNSIYILLAMGLSETITINLVKLKIENISSFKNLTEEEFFILNGKKLNSTYIKIDNAVQKYMDYYNDYPTYINNEPATNNLINFNVDISKSINKMDTYFPISLYSLVEFNSVKVLTEFSKKSLYLIDFFYPNISVFDLSIQNQKKYISIRSKIKSKNLSFANLDSIFMITYLGVSKSIVNKLYNSRITTVSRAKKEIKKSTKIIDTDISMALNKIENFEYSFKLDKYLFFIINSLEKRGKLTYQEIVALLSEEQETILTILNDALVILQKKKLIFQKGNNWFLYTYSLDDISTYNFIDKEIFIERMNGRTLQEIAIDMGLTRERVRQLEAGILNLLPFLREDNYKNIFQNYKFNKTEFTKMFNEDERTYKYLSYFYNIGEKTPLEYIQNHEVNQFKIDEYLRDNNMFVSITGDYKDLNYKNILMETCIEHPEKHTKSSIEKLFIKNIEKLGLKVSEEINMRSLIQNANFLIESDSGQFRYYNFELITEQQRKRIINIFDIEEGIYGANYFYTKHHELIQELNLLDGHEFFDLCKVLDIKGTSKLSNIVRRSEAYIGNINKEKFIKNLITEHDGKTTGEFCHELEKLYGLKINSMMSYIFDKFPEYIYNQELIASKKVFFNDDKINLVKAQLKEKLYTKKEFISIINEFYPHLENPFSKSFLNRISFIAKEDSVFKKNHNLTSIINNTLKQNDIFDITEYFKYSEISVRNSVAILQKNLSIFRISHNKYISSSYLNKHGVKKELLINFINNVRVFSEEYKYISLNFIVNHGFNDPLFEFGFEDIFYEELIWLTEEFRKMGTNTQIFVRRPHKNSLEQFLSDLLVRYEIVDADDFMDDIYDEYGLSLDLEDMKYRIISYGSYYSKELNRFYFDKSDYYREVYGEYNEQIR